MNSLEYLDAVQAKLSVSSDYALAKHLKITQSAVSAIRHGKSYIGDATALKIAEILGMHPAIVIADAMIARSKTEDLRRVWEDVAAKFPRPKMNKLHTGKSAANPHHA